MRWLFPAVNSDTVTRLSRELDVPPLLARLLVLRGIDEPEAAQRFLHPSLDQLHDPFLMADMAVAIARLRRAIERQEKVLIYGDYDVDGAMAVVVLLAALRSLGAKVEAYIPHRLTDGYGMRASVIEQAVTEGYGVVVSVDTGIREHQVIARARELGIDCIVTDHHLPQDQLPPACAILNPRRPDCAYPDKNLAGVGVAFKLVQGLLGSKLSEGLTKSYLKIVAIGTIADVVPLVGENRVIAHFGLAGLQHPVRPGLTALLSVAGLEGRSVSAGDVAFRIAPRLNAAGRMEHAREVIELLTTSDGPKARAIAERVEGLNRERQQVEDEVLGEIMKQMELQPEMAGRFSLVFAGEGWHRGVIGIVAQRVVERTHRPTLVISLENGVGHGSGRSTAKLHLLNALTGASNLFERYGGHAQAAGFTLRAERIGELERQLENHTRSLLKLQDLEPVLSVDAEINLKDIDWKFREAVRKLEPFGCGNSTPIFATQDLRLVSPPRVLEEKHLKLMVSDGRKSFEALGWGQAAQAVGLGLGQRLDLAFSLDENVFQDLITLQLIIKDFQFRAGQSTIQN
jgi:single-stranded-DNA-specific exonuclease